MATDWVALRAVWAEIATPDRAAALAYFRLSESDLMNFTLAQLIAAYEAL
jgi:hypothetical protein